MVADRGRLLDEVSVTGDTLGVRSRTEELREKLNRLRIFVAVDSLRSISNVGADVFLRQGVVFVDNSKSTFTRQREGKHQGLGKGTGQP